MPHDMDGKPLAVGDRVLMEAVVTQVSPGNDNSCNVSLKPRDEDDNGQPIYPQAIAACAKQLRKVATTIMLVMVTTMLAAMMVACDHPVSLTGTLTAHVANLLPELITTAHFEEGLSAVNAQLEQEGIPVQLAAARQLRGVVDPPNVVLEPAGLPHDEDDGVLHVVLPDGYQPGDPAWRDQLLEQVREAYRRRSSR